MADVHRFSERVIDLAERTSAVADAAQGKGIHTRRPSVSWLVLPAVGAGLYALMTNRSFTRQAKGMMDQAKERASDLPEELVDRVQQTTGQKATSSSNSRSSTRKSSSRSSSGRASRRRNTSSSR